MANQSPSAALRAGLAACVLLFACSHAEPQVKPAPPPPRPASPPPVAAAAEGATRGPQAMTPEEFHTLTKAVDREPGDKAKLSVVETALRQAWITTEQAGKLLEHIVYRQSKLDAVPVLKERILDKQNAYLLYQHFTYREDKEKVREMLEK